MIGLTGILLEDEGAGDNSTGTRRRGEKGEGQALACGASCLLMGAPRVNEPAPANDPGVPFPRACGVSGLVRTEVGRQG